MKLEKVTSKNIWEIVKLKVSESQKNFVAPNDASIMEAYLALANNGYAFPFGIYVDDDYENPPKIAYGNYNIWRLMIDEKYQNKGYGEKALQLALDYIKKFPCGNAKYCYLSYDEDNEIAKKLYAKYGFVENGEKDDDEIIAVLKLSN